jgi:uncharacterized paraquat-inducible protein A
MSAGITCPKCGGPTTTEQIDYRKRAYCRHCGGLPYRDGRPETGRGHVAVIPAVAERESA